jgi:energy-coupling factor transport system permease protein
MSSRFNFIGSTALGQYFPTSSWFHQRDPRARLLGISILFIGVLFAPHPIALTLGLISGLGIYLLAGIPFKPAWNGIKRSLIFIIILVILQILFGTPLADEDVIWQFIGIEITASILTNAFMLIYRFVVMIILINGLVMTISTAQITAALFHLLKPFERIGFPVNDLTMVVQITLRYLPLVAQIAEKITKAQASRGGDWEKRGFSPIQQAKRILPLIIPIIINSLKKAEIMALAMESRGFNAAEKRSSFYALNFAFQDAILIILCLLLSSLMIISKWMI